MEQQDSQPVRMSVNTPGVNDVPIDIQASRVVLHGNIEIAVCQARLKLTLYYKSCVSHSITGWC